MARLVETAVLGFADPVTGLRCVVSMLDPSNLWSSLTLVFGSTFCFGHSRLLIYWKRSGQKLCNSGEKEGYRGSRRFCDAFSPKYFPLPFLPCILRAVFTDLLRKVLPGVLHIYSQHIALISSSSTAGHRYSPLLGGGASCSEVLISARIPRPANDDSSTTYKSSSEQTWLHRPLALQLVLSLRVAHSSRIPGTRSRRMFG